MHGFVLRFYLFIYLFIYLFMIILSFLPVNMSVSIDKITTTSFRFPWQNLQTLVGQQIAYYPVVVKNSHGKRLRCPIRSTTQIWVVARHHCGMSALDPLTSFCGRNSPHPPQYSLLSTNNHRSSKLPTQFVTCYCNLLFFVCF